MNDDPVNRLSPSEFEETEVITRWLDFDLAGHVTDAMYPLYFSDSRGEFLAARVGSFEEFPCVLMRIEIDYKREIRYPARTLLLRTRIDNVGRSSVSFEQQLVRPDGVIAAVARAVLVSFDTERRESIPISDAYRARLLGPPTNDRQA